MVGCKDSELGLEGVAIKGRILGGQGRSSTKIPRSDSL